LHVVSCYSLPTFRAQGFMTQNFEDLINRFSEKLPDLLDAKLPHVSGEQRDLLVALATDAINGLRTSLWQGPDRLGAIKLVFQMCGLLKDPPKQS
jgi:hypothetical protein